MVVFSRVREAVGEIQRREWVLLALESLGILAGILIAFQLNEWAARRKEQARNHEVVERLFDESKEIVAQLRLERDAVKKMTDRELAFATALVRDRKCPPASAWFSAVTVNMYPTLAVPTSVYEEMMGAGGLATIDIADARRSVSRFHRLLDWTNRQTEFFRSHMTPTIQMDDPRVTATFEPGAEEPLGLQFDREALCVDQVFRNRVADEVRDHQLVYSTRADLLASAIKMCTALGRALNKPCTIPPAQGAA